MAHVPLVECHLLDPRPWEEAHREPIADAVNIPLGELEQRTSELPPRDETIRVAGPADLAQQAVRWLNGHGRHAVFEPGSTFAGKDRPAAVGRLWRPNAFLAEVLSRLGGSLALPRRALDLACGTGRDAVYAASCGWHVTAIDILPDALERARRLAARCAPAIEPVEWVEADLERDPPGFPCSAGPPCPAEPRRTRRSGATAEFDLIFSIRYLHRPLLSRLTEWLKPGGSVVYETFTTLHRQRYGRPWRDEHVLKPGELPTLFGGLEIRHFSEGWRGPAHTARIWAVAP